MSKFNFNNTSFGDSNIFLGNDTELKFKEMTVIIDGKKVVDKKQISVKIKNGDLVIDTQVGGV